MVVVPAVSPVTRPEDEPIEATEGLLLVHVPPAELSESVVVPVKQTLGVPKIGVGESNTVTTVSVVHPVASV